tara:strand:+ start:84 stop:947 length:864 start_codon:yes stop_codon:yes gene_type:complete
MTIQQMILASVGASGDGILQDLIALAQTLSSATVPTPSSVGSIQSTIQSANTSFNTFALVGYNANAENLAGYQATGGRRTLTSPGFNFNYGSLILSTGNTIVDMTGGAAAGLAIIDGKKWMASAQFNGSSFDGILLWIFTGDAINSQYGTISSGTRTVTNVKSIFDPQGVKNSDHHHFYPIAISPNGSITSSTTSGANGWNYSNNQDPGSNTGYNSTSRFANDDGLWGFRINGFADGNNTSYSIFTTNGYGIGNLNGGDTSQPYSYWNGSQSSSNNNFLGFIFSGDN